MSLERQDASMKAMPQEDAPIPLDSEHALWVTSYLDKYHVDSIVTQSSQEFKQYSGILLSMHIPDADSIPMPFRYKSFNFHFFLLDLMFFRWA